MDLEIETIPLRHGAATVVRVVGELDVATSERLETLADDRDSVAGPIVIDLSACSFIDSVALGQIMVLSRQHDASGEPVRVAIVAHHGSQIGRLFTVAGAHHALPIFETLAGALAGLDRKPGE
jgi:anti-anti-sigma factor